MSDKKKENKLAGKSKAVQKTKKAQLKLKANALVDSMALEKWQLSANANEVTDKAKAAVSRYFSSDGWEDGEFMDDVSQATLRGAHPAANLLFWVSSLFVIVLLVWANYAEIDEVTHGEGKVIPSTKVQEIQHGEGGIVKGIFIREGDIVKKGDVLILIDDTEFASSLEEKKTKHFTLLAEISRLEYELLSAEDRPAGIEYPAEVIKNAAGVIASQNNIFQARQSELSNTISILNQQLQQKDQDVKEAETRMGQTARAYEFSKKELDLTMPLLKEGVVSKVEVLRLERTVNDLLGEKETAELAVTRAGFSEEESKQRRDEAVAKFRTEALVELGSKTEEMQRIAEILKADAYRVDRTSVRAPVDATVKQVLVNTIGGVVTKDEILVELIPIDDKLLVEAKVRPKDIAFLRPLQKAKVKITAYDFSVYGGLDAELEYIGADTVTDDKGNPFYHIRVRTDKNYLGKDSQKLPIIPGMVATVDILTGKKTVLDYILKPFNKMRENALRER
ncbi:MAG: adhesin transport system membrane fusion protein [Alphaproteobacteria bacterium]|jgi:adhesin transport system membrane fusion protein